MQDKVRDAIAKLNRIEESLVLDVERKLNYKRQLNELHNALLIALEDEDEVNIQRFLNLIEKLKEYE